MPRTSNAKAKANPHFHILTLKTLLSTPSFEGCSSESPHKGRHPLKGAHLWSWALQLLLLPWEHTAHAQLKEQSCPMQLGVGHPQLYFSSPQMVFFGYMVFSIVLGLLADRYGCWKVSDCRGCACFPCTPWSRAG